MMSFRGNRLENLKLPLSIKIPVTPETCLRLHALAHISSFDLAKGLP